MIYENNAVYQKDIDPSPKLSQGSSCSHRGRGVRPARGARHPAPISRICAQAQATYLRPEPMASSCAVCQDGRRRQQVTASSDIFVYFEQLNLLLIRQRLNLLFRHLAPEALVPIGWGL